MEISLCRRLIPKILGILIVALLSSGVNTPANAIDVRPECLPLPNFAAPTVVEQKIRNCDYPETRCYGVEVIFNTTASADWNPQYMSGLSLGPYSPSATIENG